MATKQYLHNASKDTSGGTYPSGEQSASTADLTWTGATTLRTMNGTIGTSQVNTSQATLGVTTAQKHFVRFYCSDALSGAQTVGGGSLTFNAAHSENSTAANFGIDGLNVYVWRPSTGAKVGTLVDTTAGLSATEAALTSITTIIFSVATAAISAASGDVVIVEVWTDFTQGSTAIRTVNFVIDGTVETLVNDTVVTDHASFVSFAENLTFGAGGTSILKQMMNYHGG